MLYNFQNNGDANGPAGALIFDAAGNLYGATPLGGAAGTGAVYELSPQSGGAWNESVIYSFPKNYGGRAAFLNSSLIMDPAAISTAPP